MVACSPQERGLVDADRPQGHPGEPYRVVDQRLPSATDLGHDRVPSDAEFPAPALTDRSPKPTCSNHHCRPRSNQHRLRRDLIVPLRPSRWVTTRPRTDAFGRNSHSEGELAVHDRGYDTHQYRHSDSIEVRSFRKWMC